MTFLGGFSYVFPTTNEMAQSVQLQTTIAAATSGIGELPLGVKHHPVTCTGRLGFNEEGVLSCEHGEVPVDDPRTRACLIHSLAILIVEEAFNFTEMKELPYDRK